MEEWHGRLFDFLLDIKRKWILKIYRYIEYVRNGKNNFKKKIKNQIASAGSAYSAVLPLEIFVRFIIIIIIFFYFIDSMIQIKFGFHYLFI